jgi:rRNA maturation endonuclease Nob1
MESRREKIRASLLVLFIALSTREARWYRLRAKDANDKYSLSFLCGVSQDRLDDLLVECDFLRAYGKEYRVRARAISLFLDASAVDTELVHSQVDGNREHFLRIGAFGESPRFTAKNQFDSGMKSLQYEESTREAGNTFRQSVNEASETTAGTTGETTEETTEKTNEPHTNEITEPHTKDTSEVTTEETAEGTTEQTTEPTQPCTGWSGEEHRKIIQLSTAAAMRDTEKTANHLPLKFPLCGSFKERDGYNKLEIRMDVAANGQSADFVLRSKECLLDFPKDKRRRLCPSCGSLVQKVKGIRRQGRQEIDPESNLHITENQVIQMTPAEKKMHKVSHAFRRRTSLQLDLLLLQLDLVLLLHLLQSCKTSRTRSDRVLSC